MSAPQPQSDWTQLFRIACALTQQANIATDDWTFGGGTAMMLQIDHRESNDVDIFLSDPQLLPFLDPRTHDFGIDIRPIAYRSDGAKSIKFVFDTGEIDFVVAPALTSSPTIRATVEGVTVLLETIPEIITKKIYYRGAGMMPRDIFDLAAAGKQYEAAIVQELRSYPDKVTEALAAMHGLRPRFVNDAIADLTIKDRYKELAKTALERSKEILRAV